MSLSCAFLRSVYFLFICLFIEESWDFKTYFKVSLFLLVTSQSCLNLIWTIRRRLLRAIKSTPFSAPEDKGLFLYRPNLLQVLYETADDVRPRTISGSGDWPLMTLSLSLWIRLKRILANGLLRNSATPRKRLSACNCHPPVNTPHMETDNSCPSIEREMIGVVLDVKCVGEQLTERKSGLNKPLIYCMRHAMFVFCVDSFCLKWRRVVDQQNLAILANMKEKAPIE